MLQEASEIFRNVAQGIGALTTLILISVLLIYLRNRPKSSGGFFGDMFLSRRKRVEKNHLLIRGPHYPRKVVKVKLKKWYKSRWGK